MHASHATTGLLASTALLALLALFAPALPLACSSGPPSAATACTDYERASCQKLAQCDSIEMQIEYAGSVDSCVASYGSECTTAMTINGIGITPSSLEGCVSATNDESCSDYASYVLPAACVTPPGTLADGVPCFEDDQCKGGECNFGTSTDVPVGSDAGAPCGTCTEKPATSATGCANEGNCPSGQVCVASFGGTGTENSLCVTPLAADTPCQGNASPCQGGLVCGSAGTTGGPATCQTPPSAGQPCLGETCANGSSCYDGTCVAPQFIPLGGSCSFLPAADAGVAMCAGGDCVGGVCVAYAALGASCGLDGDPTCAPQLACASGRCASDVEAIPAACN